MVIVVMKKFGDRVLKVKYCYIRTGKADSVLARAKVKEYVNDLVLNKNLRVEMWAEVEPGCKCEHCVNWGN